MADQLRDYQLAAIDKMHTGSILCGGVGSGKSVTSLAYYYICEGGRLVDGRVRYRLPKEPRDLYIITTARKRDTREWEDELSFISMRPDCNAYNNKIVIDSWNNIKKYEDVTGAYFIFDEQRVVGYGAWTKSFLKITKANEWILLSATPGDTWQDYIPVFIANGFYKNKTEFTRNHCVYSHFSNYPKIDRYVDTGKLIRLRSRILVEMKFVRPTISHDILVKTKYDKEKYKTLQKERWNVEKDEPIETASELCYALRKIANTDPDKIDNLKKLISEHPKSIIFYNFDYELDMIVELLESIGYSYAQWNGHKHQPIPKEDSWAYLVQYNAGAEGWNCIETDTIIFFSDNYSYKMMIQAAGRINRMNTKFIDLYFYHMKSTSPIDIAISRALAEKKNFNEGRFVSKI